MERAKLPTLPASDLSHFTVVFRGSILDVPGNPFSVQSDFGEAVSSGYGDAFAKADALEEALYRALPFVEDAVDDPAYKGEPVRAILNQIKKALGED